MLDIQARPRRASQSVAANDPREEFQLPLLRGIGGLTMCSVSNEVLVRQLSEELGATAIFVFLVGEKNTSQIDWNNLSVGMHDQIVFKQAQLLSLHVEAMNRSFVISDIYVHPLLGKKDLLDGHRIVSFAGTPIRSKTGELIGTLCVVDTKVRNWSDREIGVLKRIAAEVEGCGS